MKKRDALADALAYLERCPTATAEVQAERAHDNFRGLHPLHVQVERWAEHHSLTIGSDRPDNIAMATVYRFKRK